MKLTNPQRYFLTKLAHDGQIHPGPATGNVAKALKKRGLARELPVYCKGYENHPQRWNYVSMWVYEITAEGLAWLREHGAA